MHTSDYPPDADGLKAGGSVGPGASEILAGQLRVGEVTVSIELRRPIGVNAVDKPPAQGKTPTRRPSARLLTPLGVLEGKSEHGTGGDRPVRLALQPRRHRPRVHDRVTPLINFDELRQ